MNANSPIRPFFHRMASLESFTQFLCPERIAAIRQHDPVARRRRQQGLEGFLWLGVLVAAFGNLSSLHAIFHQVGMLLAGPCELPVPLISVSAFSQYRLRVSLCLLRRFWDALVAEAREARPESHATWRGLRLWAMDGTALVLPEALWPAFRSHHGCRGDGPAQAQMVVLYDLYARVPCRLRVGPYDKTKERAVAPRLIGGLGDGDLVLVDGGFYSIRLLAQLDRKGVKFLIPMRKNGQPKRIRAFGTHDGLYEIRASKSYWKDTPGVPDKMTVRIVQSHRKGFLPRRLVTNLLDPQAWPAGEVADIYHERWHIETFYRDVKHVLKAETWHTRTIHGFYAELMFIMILATMTRLAMADAAGDRPPGTLSFTQSLEWMQTALILSARVPVAQWPGLYDQVLAEIAQCKTDVRPGRAFERNRQKRRQQSRAKRLAEEMAHGT